MKRLCSLVALVLAGGSGWPSAMAGDERLVVAVFDVQVRRVKLTRSQRDMLTEVMAEELALGGVYQVMPPGDVKRVLLEQSAESFKECFDERCQIELGRQLPANKLVTHTIKKIAGQCRVTASLYDLKRQTTDTTAKAVGKCTEGELVKSIEKIAAKLRQWVGGSAPGVDLPPASDQKPAASADDEEYKRALNQAWRKLAMSVRKGTTEQNLERYQEFLADFPMDNPYADKVQKAIDALEAKLEKEEDARRKAEAEENERLARVEVEKKEAEEKARREKLAKSNEVKQPGTSLYWLRCPIGQRWTGSSCEGKVKHINWHKAKNACSSGYRLPTRQEFVSLLGGCDAKVRGGGEGYCSECSNSGKCSSMFGEDERRYWSSSSCAADSSYAWRVSCGYGYVGCLDKGFDGDIRCVRSGP